MTESIEVRSTETALQPKISELIGTGLSFDRPEEPNDYQTLLNIALEAVRFFPPLYAQSIFGPVRNWIPPYRQDSEYTILNPWRPVRSMRYLLDISVPAYSHAPGRWTRTLLPLPVQRLFWRPSDYFQQADPYGGVTSFADEHWFYINGIATNQAVAEMNSNLLSQLFHRPITVIHNATDSFLFDLIECAIGKSFKTDPSLEKTQTMTEPAIKATVAILQALNDPEKERVVLLCHSQGTIIAANVVRALQNCLHNICHLDEVRAEQQTQASPGVELIDELALTIFCEDKESCEAFQTLERALKKLEIYTFANCADTMKYVTTITNAHHDSVGLPYIENFANQFDLVARLGVLSPAREWQPPLVKIDGDLYEKRGGDAWGHLLNQHYLFGIEAHLKDKGRVANPYQHTQESAKQPRLYGYFGGGRLSPYYE